MTNESIRKIIALNITENRKRLGITQSELAEKINYSDKSVSKWERGDGLPDIVTIMTLAEIFGVSVDDLLHSPEERPEKPAEPVLSTDSRDNRKGYFITILSVIGVWIIGITIMCMFRSIAPDVADLWNTRIFTITLLTAFIVLLVLSCLWMPKPWIFISCSGIIWSAALTVFSVFGLHIFPVSLIMQLVVAVCFIWYITSKRTK